MKQDEVLHQLIQMSRTLGDPANDYAILGEGNSSARADDDSFWVKASGAELRTIDDKGFVRVKFKPVLDMLRHDVLSDEAIKDGLTAAKVDAAVAVRPSVETVLHALALGLQGVDFIGHTHPTAINAILCSRQAQEAVAGRLFPDEIVYCGVAPVFVPYTDPGLPLARKVRDLINQYLETYGQVPRVILMQNHGLIALGNTPEQVENITAMAVKAARVLLGTYALGGPRFLSEQDVARIHSRPDEEYRRRFWKH
jgi:rhamnose utilization protein RhaD (predicted bifunctional aldolase and dehydrogenase)